MNILKKVLFCLLGVVLAAPAYSSDPAKREELRVKSSLASALGPSLPRVPLEAWIRDLVGKSAELQWETNVCGEQSGSGTENQVPVCVEVTIVRRNSEPISVRFLAATTRRQNHWRIEDVPLESAGIYLPRGCSRELTELPVLLAAGPGELEQTCSYPSAREAESTEEDLLSCHSKKLNSRSTPQTLVQLFGASNVKPADVDIGEGETQAGMVVFPDDSHRRFYMLRRDSPAMVSITIRDKQSRWRIGPLRMGSTLKQMEQSNGKPFTLLGFGWDYDGTVNSWEGGTLQAQMTGQDCRTIVRFGLSDSASAQQQETINQVLGDKVFSSSNPAMQGLDPRVYEIIVVYEKQQDDPK